MTVAGCRLQVTGCRLQVAGYGLQVAGCRVQVTGYFLISYFIFSKGHGAEGVEKFLGAGCWLLVTELFGQCRSL